MELSWTWQRQKLGPGEPNDAILYGQLYDRLLTMQHDGRLQGLLLVDAR